MTGLYFDLAPKDPIENLQWRIRCRERAIVDKKFRDVLYQACMQDLSFWMAFACIGKGTRVVTDRGPIPIQDVTANDLVWDGAEWVCQGGAIYRGRRASIFAYKINVTPDHEIWTQHGWKPASERHDREGVRIPDGYSEKWQLQKYNEGSVAVPMQVRQGNDCSWRQSSRRQEHKLRMQVERSQVHSRNERKPSVHNLEWYASAMHKQAVQSLETLRWSWNQSLRTMAEVRELLRGHGRTARRSFIGSLSKQRWQLRAKQLSLGYVVGTNVESAPAHNGEARNAGRSNDHIRDHGSYWTDTCRSFVSDKDGIPARSVTSASTQNTKVYDLLNCGPRQCFTVLDADDRPLLVHNCWGYDPRARVKIVPFIPYPHQADVFVRMDEAITTAEKEERSVDVILDKARAQGGTFGYLWVDLRRWLRDPMFSAGYVTRNEDLIDSKSDSSTVLWKIAWAIERLPFWMKPNYERHLGHHTFINNDNGALLRGYSAGQDVAAGGRAAQPLDSSVLTPTGPKMMGEIAPGDFVIGANGKPTKVVSIHPLGQKQAFRVRFSDGSSTECCDDHLWTVTERWSRDSRKHHDPVTKPLRDLRQSLRADRSGQKAWNYQIPMTAPVEFSKTSLKIHPYVLGCLLGDGCFRHSSPTFTTSDEEMAETIGNLLPPSLSMIRCGEIEYRISTGKRGHGQVNPVSNALRELSLWMKTSHTKFIPDIYKYAASPEDRLELLRGLLDTDGWVHLRKRKMASAKVCYCSVSRQMVEDVRFVVQSLGGSAGMVSVTQLTGKKYERTGVIDPKDVIYSLRIAMPNGMNPFKLSRKKNKYVERSKYQPRRSIVSVEPSRITDVQCIRVEAEDGLYLTDDCIVTHNTVFTVDEAGARDFVQGGKDEAVQESIQDVSNCLKWGVLVVTDHGLVPIENVQLHHKVWDGIMWVSHEGCVYQGEQETIQSYGIELTPDHRVLTTKGWKHARDIGFDRENISLPDGYRDEWPHEVWQDNLAMSVQVRKTNCSFGEFAQSWSHKKLRLLEVGEFQEKDDNAWNAKNANMECVGVHDSAMHQSEKHQLSQVWCSWNQGLRSVDEVRKFSCGHGREAGRIEHRQDRQRKRLLPRELQVGNEFRTGSESALLSPIRNTPRGVDGQADFADDRFELLYDHGTHQERLDRGCSIASIPNLNSVYDLLNCGPRRAFTVIDNNGRPLLVHNCVRLVSARYVDQGVFHNACENPDTAKNGVHLILDWKDHPQQSKHSYIVREGIVAAIKPEDQAAVNEYHKKNPDLRARLERKGFKYEKVIRSPWYDSRCLRPTATPRLIASQLDRNPRGAVGKVFSSELLDRMKAEKCKPHVWVGNPVFDSETCELTGLIQRDDGCLKLWFRPGIDNSPPLGPFTAGADIASGGVSSGASNSALCALDDRTGEQVLEYAIKGLEPRPFARRVVGLCMWLRNAKLGWEDSGVSGGFAKEVMEVLCYGNVYFRPVTQIGSSKKSSKPGWSCHDPDKADMFEQFSLAMDSGDFVPRSQEMIIECGEYEWDGTKIVHVPSKSKGENNKNHADRAIASAGCWLVFNTDNFVAKIDTDEENGQTPEYGSFKWREDQERRAVHSDSPDYGIRDVVGY